MQFKGERIFRFSDMKEGKMYVLMNEELRNGDIQQKAYALVFMKKKIYEPYGLSKGNKLQEIAYYCDIINAPHNTNSEFIIYETIDQTSLDEEKSALYTLMEI